MKSRYTVQDAYKVRITADISPISTSGDPLTEYSFTVETAPTDSEWRLVINFNDTARKDKIYFHRRSTTTLYYYRKNRGNPTVTHYENEYVQMNNFAERFNYNFDNVDDFWLIQDMWTNKAVILGGMVDYWSWVVEIANTATTELADWTRYAVLDYADGTLKFVDTYTIATHCLLWQVVVVSIDITSITDKRHTDLLKNKTVVNDLTDSWWLLAYKWIPIWSWWGDVETWTVISETTGTRTANLGEYIVTNYASWNTTINLPASVLANKGWRLCVKKWLSTKRVDIIPFSWDTIDGFSALLQIQNQNSSVTLVSKGDWTRSIE